MKKVKKTALKRMVSLILSAMLLAGIVYIPKVTTSDALAGLPDEYAEWELVGTLKGSSEDATNEFGRCRGINSNLVIEGTPMATAGQGGNIHNVINLYWDLRAGRNNSAIYCLEPSADYLPTSSGQMHDSNIWVDSPVGKGHIADAGSQVDNIELEQTKLLSYALALGQQNYPGDLISSAFTDESIAVITPDLDNNNPLVRGAATQLIVWSIAQQWYKDPEIMGISPTDDPLNTLGVPDYGVPENSTGIHKFVQNFPNVQNAIESIWAEIWAAINAEKAVVLDGVSYDPNNKDAYTYTMTWDPELRTYIVEIPVGDNLGEYEIKSIDPEEKIVLDITSKNNKIIVTGDPGLDIGGGVIAELQQKLQNTECIRYRAVVGYIVSVRKGNDDYSRDQTLITCVELYRAHVFSDNRAYFKVVRPEETTALIQKKIDENSTRKSLEGFKFNIYHYDGGETGLQLEGPNEDKSFTTDENGQIILSETSPENLTPGRYWIEEIEQPNSALDGYTNPYQLIKTDFMVKAKSYDADADPAVNYFEFENTLVEIELKKELDARSGDTLDDFRFDIFEINAAGNGPDLDKRVAYVVTDENGVAKVNKGDPLDETPGNQTYNLSGETLPKGNYWIRERLTAKSRKYYLIDRSILIKNVGENQYILKNELLEVKPVKEVDDRADDTPDGFEFDIYEMNEEGDGPDLEKPVAYVVTDEDGAAKVNQDNPLDETPGNQTDDLNGKILPKGNYWVRERLTEKSKKYYLIDEEICVVNIKDDIAHKNAEDDKIQYFPVENELRKVLIEKTMSDDDGPGGPRDKEGIRFRIFPIKFKNDYKNKAITWEEIIAGKDADPENKYFAEEFGIDANGNYILEGIPEGRYWIEELPHEKNKGYYLIDEKITICESGYYIDDGGIVEFEVSDSQILDTPDKINGRRYIIKPLTNELIPPATEPNTIPTTTQPTTPTTTQPTSEDITTTETPTTTQPSTQPTITEPSTEQETTTEEYIDTTVPLESGFYGNYDEDDDLWYIYDENDTPLVIVKLPEDEDIEDFDFGEWKPPLINITTSEEEDRDNPKTGDNLWTILGLTGLLGLSLAGIILTRKRTRKK